MPEYPPLICGIDPGASGGIAMLSAPDATLSCIPLTYKMPDTETDLAELIREFAPHIVAVYLEKVHAMPAVRRGKDGKVLKDEAGEPIMNEGIASAAKFSAGYGFIRGCLVMARIPLFDVQPERWQKFLSIPPRGKKSKTEHKNILKGRAQQWWPHIKITHAIADALLIAEYGRRVHV